MITLTRNQVRRLRQVFRRSVLGITHKGTIPPLVLRAEGAQLRAHYRYRDLAVECVEPGSYRPAMSLAIPLDALADFEGSKDSPVVLEAAAPDRTVVRWEDRAIPQSREYEVVPRRPRGPGPGAAGDLGFQPGRAADGAGRRDRDGHPRLGPLRPPLRPAPGHRNQVVATDGRQLLVRIGFRFPWTGDLLIKGSPIFACRTLPRDRPVEVGRTDSHVFFRSRHLDDRLRDPEGGPVPGRRAGHPAGLGGPDPAAAGPRGRALPRVVPGPPARGRRAQQPGDRGPERQDRRPGECLGPAPAGHRAGPQPVELYRRPGVHRHQSRVPGPGVATGLRRDRLHRGRVAVRLPGSRARSSPSSR